jgi:hypothetical protein
MEEREADATIAAVLGYPPLEIARAFQDPDFASKPQPPSEPSGAPWAHLVALYQTNQSLWKAEDAAHATGIADETLANLKRQIDSLNLRRNELIEAIDQIFRKLREIITAVISGRRTLRQTPRAKIHRAPNDFRAKGKGSASKSSNGKERSADPTFPDTAER